MKRLLLACAFLVATPAVADLPPVNMRIENGVLVGTLCSGQTATATGCTSGGDELVAMLKGYTSVALYSNQSTSTSYTCDAFTSDNGYDADSGVGQDRSTTSLSNTQEMITLDGAIDYLWIECSSIANNAVTVTFRATK